MKTTDNQAGRKERRRWVSRSAAGKASPQSTAGVSEPGEPRAAMGGAASEAQPGRFVRWLYRARPLRVLSWPVLWFCIVPIAFLHLMAIVYQWVCFPVFGIPFVRARDYIAMDRHRLGYLGIMAKLSCAYCGYVNGALAYVSEVAGRTEQHWCPIKHSLRLKAMHARYDRFLDYGDAAQFRRRFEHVRRDFSDLA